MKKEAVYLFFNKLKPLLDKINPVREKKINYKSKSRKKVDPVTYFDLKIEKSLFQLISKNFPDHQIISEEKKNKITNSKYKWVIDPIDGTKAFLMGIPTWSNLLGFTINNTPTVGFANFPMLKKLFFSDGLRSFLIENKQKKIISTKKNKSKYLRLAINSHYPVFKKNFLKFLTKFNGIKKFSGLDAYNYCLLAEGKIDIIIDAELKDYDIIPLIPILKNAGAIITNFRGGKDISKGELIVSRNQKIHNLITKQIKKFKIS